MSIYLGNQLIAGDNSSFANQDLSNITATAKEVICHNVMPADNVYVTDLSNATPPYTATSDGYFYVVGQTGSGAAYVYAINNTTNIQHVALGSGGANIMSLVPVAKGQSMTYVTFGDISVVNRYFYKCIGEA